MMDPAWSVGTADRLTPLPDCVVQCLINYPVSADPYSQSMAAHPGMLVARSRVSDRDLMQTRSARSRSRSRSASPRRKALGLSGAHVPGAFQKPTARGRTNVTTNVPPSKATAYTGSKDAFRMRKSNSGRAPSKHVDDFLAEQKNRPIGARVPASVAQAQASAIASRSPAAPPLSSPLGSSPGTPLLLSPSLGSRSGPTTPVNASTSVSAASASGPPLASNHSAHSGLTTSANITTSSSGSTASDRESRDAAQRQRERAARPTPPSGHSYAGGTSGPQASVRADSGHSSHQASSQTPSRKRSRSRSRSNPSYPRGVSPRLPPSLRAEQGRMDTVGGAAASGASAGGLPHRRGYWQGHDQGYPAPRGASTSGVDRYEHAVQAGRHGADPGQVPYRDVGWSSQSRPGVCSTVVLL